MNLKGGEFMTTQNYPPKTDWKYSISEVTTYHLSFDEDVKLYNTVGCQGIGVWGFKMERLGNQRAKELLDRFKLQATNCIPDGNSILPYALSPSPEDPRKRVEAFLPNLESMAKLNPTAIVVITGPQGNYSAEEAHDLCMEGFTRIGKVANDLGITMVLEPIHKSVADEMTMIWDIPGTLKMLDELNQPSFKILFDTWHLWDTSNILDLISKNISLIGGVHVSDWRESTRSWPDRAFPGEGKLPMMQILRTLDNAGYRGYYDVEIFSDDGEFGNDYEDSLWKLSPEEIVDRATRIFRLAERSELLIQGEDNEC
jgi:sugar phosphate isomerase/epimerase